MGRLIDEDDVVDWLLKRTEMYDGTGHFVDENVVKKNIESQIAKIPTAQPEPIKLHVDHTLTEEEIKNLKHKIADSPIVLMPSAQPERIQNNAVHLCDSCQYTYVTCPSHDNDAFFGDGKGNGNICACNKYRPISAQPERPTGEWIVSESEEVGALGIRYRTYTCPSCGWSHSLIIQMNFCPNCGNDNRGEQDE